MGCAIKEIYTARNRFYSTEEMKTTRSSREVPQTFFQNFLYLQKYDLIHLALNRWQPCIFQFMLKFLQTKIFC